MASSRSILQGQMSANLRITAAELIYFQDLCRAGAGTDEVKLDEASLLLAEKVPESVKYFEKSFEELPYFKSVHPRCFILLNTEITPKRAAGTFLFFWYVIRPFSAVASSEERFTFHTLQHAVFEFSMFLDSLRLATFVQAQMQNVAAFLSNSFEQQKNAWTREIQTLKDSLVAKESEFSKYSVTFEEKTKDLTDKLQGAEKLCADRLTECIDCRKKLESCRNESEEKTKNLDEIEARALRCKLESDSKCETFKLLLERMKQDFDQNKRTITSLTNDLETSHAEILQLRETLNFETRKAEEARIEYAKCKVQGQAKETFSDSSKFRSDISKLQKKIVDLQKRNEALENDILSLSTPSCPSSPLLLSEMKSMNMKTSQEKLDEKIPLKIDADSSIKNENVRNVRIYVDICSMASRGEKIVNMLQNFAVSSLIENADKSETSSANHNETAKNEIIEFPAWLLVAQSLLRSMCLDIGLCRGFLFSCYKENEKKTIKRQTLNTDTLNTDKSNTDTSNADTLDTDTSVGLLVWKVECRFRALSMIRNRVVRGFSSVMGGFDLRAFGTFISEQQNVLASKTLQLETSSSDRAFEISSLNVIKLETATLISEANYVPVCGSSLIPIVPYALRSLILDSVRNLALLSVCFFISLMNAEGDAEKKYLLTIYFEMIENKILTSEVFSKTAKSLLLGPNILGWSKSKNQFKYAEVIKQAEHCLENFLSLQSESFVFFHSNRENTSQMTRMLTLHNHANSLVDSFWSTQELSRNFSLDSIDSTNTNNDFSASSESAPSSPPSVKSKPKSDSSSSAIKTPSMTADEGSDILNKIMALDVLWDKEREVLSSNARQLDAVLLSLTSETSTKPSDPEKQSNLFLHALSHLLTKGKLLVSDFPSSDSSWSEEIIGYLVSESADSQIRENLTAIQESISTFKQVRDGAKAVGVNAKSCLGKILSIFCSESKGS